MTGLRSPIARPAKITFTPRLRHVALPAYFLRRCAEGTVVPLCATMRRGTVRTRVFRETSRRKREGTCERSLSALPFSVSSRGGRPLIFVERNVRISETSWSCGKHTFPRLHLHGGLRDSDAVGNWSNRSERRWKTVSKGDYYRREIILFYSFFLYVSFRHPCCVRVSSKYRP